MKHIKRWGINLTLAVFFCAMPAVCQAEETISQDIYQWVQSTARQGYYFNKEQIQYATDAHGYIDLTKILVPTLRIYDDVQIQDVVSKRRWRMLPLDGYGDLSGAAEYLLIDLRAGVVHITAHEDLDSLWGTISREENMKEIKLAELSDKDVEKKFFDAIINYSIGHQEEMIRRSRGILSDADRAALAAKKEKLTASTENTHEKPAKKDKQEKKKKKE